MNTRRTSPADPNYALRRVLYNLMVAAEAACQLKGKGSRPTNALAKIAGLIMARNLDDFCRGNMPTKKFRLANWKVKEASLLTKSVRDRINKVVGHIVNEDPGHFDKNADVLKVLQPLISEVARFVGVFVTQSSVQYDRNAADYAAHLNASLGILGISIVPMATSQKRSFRPRRSVTPRGGRASFQSGPARTRAPRK